MEVNPGDISAAKIAAYVQAGVNRVSLGVQAFQEHLLKDMNRPHGAEEIQQTVTMLRAGGISNLSMDVILRLPGQTLRDVEETLEKLIELRPNQISVYDLDVHENTVYGMWRRQGRLPLAAEEEHAQMAEYVAQTLGKAGFRHYELSNFAQPGFESRHNLMYWGNQSYLGLGPGAFSYMNGIRYQFAGSVESYLKKTFAENWKNEIEEQLSPENIEKETLLTGIRLEEGVDLVRFSLIRSTLEKTLESLIQEKLIARHGTRVKFTSRGKLVADVILASFAQMKL